MNKISIIAVALLSLCLTTVGFAKDKYPDSTVDGLVRIKSKTLDAVYRLPDATLSGYNKVMLEDCEVTFRKNWQRDQNRSRRSGYRVTAEDMARIRNDIAERFRIIFTKELQDKEVYEIVAEAGDGVLLLRPRIVDLDVFAPDLKTPGRQTTYTTSAGRMTLRLDLVDAATGTVIGQVVDRRRAREDTFGQRTNSVTNRAESDRIIRRWAVILREALDEARDARATDD